MEFYAGFTYTDEKIKRNRGNEGSSYSNVKFNGALQLHMPISLLTGVYQ